MLDAGDRGRLGLGPALLASEAKKNVVGSAKGLYLHWSKAQPAGLATQLGQVGLARNARLDRDAAGEVDTHLQSRRDGERDRSQADDRRRDQSRVARAHERKSRLPWQKVKPRAHR